MEITQEKRIFINCGSNTFCTVFNSTQKVLLGQFMKMHFSSVISIFKLKKCELKMEITEEERIFINCRNNTFCTVFNSIQKVLLRQFMKIHSSSVISIFKLKKCDLKMEITGQQYIFINHANNTFCVELKTVQKVLLRQFMKIMTS
jgi:hypothetical protein